MIRLRVEVVQARPDGHEAAALDLPPGSSAGDAVRAAGFAAEHAALAIHGEQVSAATPLRDGDRVELLRPLATDPGEARRQRARRSARKADPGAR